MKKQTAVEWFIEEIKKLKILVPEESAIKLGELIVETKEMEKEQIIDFAEEFSMQHTYKGTVKDYYETFNHETTTY
jgi:DUF917 family protein